MKLKAKSEAGRRFLAKLKSAHTPVRVVLPNGMKLELKAPFGTDPDLFRRKVLDQYNKDAEAGLFDPTSPSGLENFRAGIGMGMVNTGRNVANIIGLKSDQSVREKQETDRPLKKTTAGFLGDLTGSVAALAPAGGPLSSALRMAASKTGLSALGGATALGAAEGALGGFVFADPAKRAENALTGALLGGALSKTLGIVGKRLPRPLKSSEAAKTVVRETGKQPPLTHFPKSEGIKNTTNIVLSNLFGTAGKVRSQLDEANTAWRNKVINPKALPGGAAGGNLQRHTEDLRALDAIKPGYGSGEQAQAILQKSWGDFYKRIPWDSLTVRLDPTKGRELFNLLKKYPSKTGFNPRQGFAFQSMNGSQFKDWRGGLQKIINYLKNEGKTRAGNHADLVKAEKLRAELPDIMEKGLELNLANSRMNTTKMNAWNNLAMFRDYKNAVSGGAYQANKILHETAQTARAKGGDYTYDVLRRASEKQANSTTGKGLLTQAANTGQQALAHFPNKGEIFQAAASAGLIGSGAAAMMLGGPAATYATPAVYAAILGLSTKPGTRFLAGNTAWQKTMADLLRKSPAQLRRQVRAKAGQAGAITFTQD